MRGKDDLEGDGECEMPFMLGLLYFIADTMMGGGAASQYYILLRL